MNKITVYVRNDYVKDNGEAAVYLRLWIKQKPVRINSGISVKPADFDPSSERIRRSHPDYRDYNLIINSCRARIIDIVKRYKLQFKELTPSLLRGEYETPSTYVDFYDFMERSINERRGEVTDITIDTHLVQLRKMKMYRKKLMFSDITEDFLKGYEKYLKIKRKNKKNTVHNSMKVIKTYLSLAKKKKLIQESPFDTFRSRTVKTERVYLTGDELRILINMYKEKDLSGSPGMHQVLRHFIFCCLTGLRMSDLRLASHEHIINDTLVLRPKKLQNVNAEIVSVPLTSLAKQLYKDENPLRINGRLFDCFADQYMNRIIKNVCRKAGINKNVTWHSARHTFATLFLERGGSVEILQRLLGHARITQTMVYVHISEKRKKEQMKKFGKYFG